MISINEIGQWLDDNAERMSMTHPELARALGDSDYPPEVMTVIVLAAHIMTLEGDTAKGTIH